MLFFQEYIQDGIDWTKVEFEDNQDCLNLFEKVPELLSMSFLFLSIRVDIKASIVWLIWSSLTINWGGGEFFSFI